jgi:uncharacterized protein (DUF3084 family)
VASCLVDHEQTCFLQAKVDAEAHKREVDKLVSERDSARTTAADLRQRRSQVEHELRRKELDFERLQKHLRELLSEKARLADISMPVHSCS